MRTRARTWLPAFVAVAAFLGLAPAALAARTVSLYSPNGYIQPGSSMYDFGEVRLEGKRLTGGFAACEQYMAGVVLDNGRATDTVALYNSFTDEYCEGQMQIIDLPRIEYAASGAAHLAGKFVVGLTGLGCTYKLTKLATPFYGRNLQFAMVKGTATRIHQEPVHGSCPLTVSATFAVFGAYDSPSMFPWEKDSRTVLSAASRRAHELRRPR